MRKNRVIGQNRCYHLVIRLAHRAFFLDDEEKCINKLTLLTPFDPQHTIRGFVTYISGGV
jgi:hypothetical protein